MHGMQRVSWWASVCGSLSCRLLCGWWNTSWKRWGSLVKKSKHAHLIYKRWYPKSVSQYCGADFVFYIHLQLTLQPMTEKRILRKFFSLCSLLFVTVLFVSAQNENRTSASGTESLQALVMGFKDAWVATGDWFSPFPIKRILIWKRSGWPK